MLCGDRHTWNIKEKTFKTCVPLVMTWLGKNLSILKRTERRMLSMMYGVQLANGANTRFNG